MTHKEFYQRYLYAGPISRDAAAVAELFTEDCVFEAPLVPSGHALPRRLVGRTAIRDGIRAYHDGFEVPGAVNFALSTYEVHTVDPDMFVAETDTVFDLPDGQQTTLSFVQIFRLRNGKIAKLRDYFRTGSTGTG